MKIGVLVFKTSVLEPKTLAEKKIVLFLIREGL
jgi:hypothetical protein